MNCSSSQPATQKSTNRKYLKIGYLAKSHSKARHVFRFVSSMPEWLKNKTLMRVIPTSRSSEVKRKQCFEHLQPWERHANSKHTKRHHARHDFPLAFYSHLTHQLRGLWDVNGRLSLCPEVSDFPPPLRHFTLTGEMRLFSLLIHIHCTGRSIVSVCVSVNAGDPYGSQKWLVTCRNGCFQGINAITTVQQSMTQSIVCRAVQVCRGAALGHCR